jgi:hypothetical protein
MMVTRRISCWFFLTTVLAFAIMASPARADFESAVAAYEQGAYSEAYSEFSTLARAGDERAQSYLNRIRRKLQAGAKTGGTASGESSAQSAPSGDSGWGEGLSAGWFVDVTPWNPLGQRPSPPSGREIEVPFHKSVWVTIFHLPADATVIGLQYVARFLDADRMYRDLQTISRNGNDITLAILAAVWWLLLLRVLYSVVQIVVRLIRVIFASQEQETYG